MDRRDLPLSERYPAKAMEGFGHVIRLAKILNADNCARAEIEGHPFVEPYGGISRSPAQWRTVTYG